MLFVFDVFEDEVQTFSLFLVELETIDYFCIALDSIKLGGIVGMKTIDFSLSLLDLIDIDDLCQSL